MVVYRVEHPSLYMQAYMFVSFSDSFSCFRSSTLGKRLLIMSYIRPSSINKKIVMNEEIKKISRHRKHERM